MHLLARDYEVKPITVADGKRFVIANHYSKGCSNTAVYAHGLFRAGCAELLGVALWLPPTRVAAESVNKENWKRVVALSRLCVHPDVPTNGASFLMGRSIRLIRQEGKWKSLVTYADEFMGHEGKIYYAANWRYVGESKPIPRWENDEGRQIARKSTVSRTKQQMLDMGLRMVGSYRKKKFVMHL